MIKRGLVIAIVFSLLLTILISCRNEDQSSNANDQEDTVSNDHINKKGIEVIFDKEKSNIRIATSRNDASISSIYQVKWTNNEEIFFNYKIANEYNETNVFYSFDISNNILEERFDIEERIWDGHVANEGKSLIYSSDGFNGLYSLNDDGTIVKIATKQSWYSISPDNTKIIVNGIPDGQDSDKQFIRYLYSIDNNTVLELSDIPNIEYVFSSIAAKWSPDSTHIVSQNGDNENSLNIINVIENKIIEKIKIQDSIIPPFPMWSPDGKKLAFMVQSKGNREYTFDDGHMYVYMADKIGIYNVEDGSVEFYNLNGKLTTDNKIQWQNNSQGVIVQTIEQNLVNMYLSEETLDGEVLAISFDYIDVDSSKDISTILKDDIRKLGGFYEHNKYLAGLFNDKILVYTEIKDNQYIINFLNVKNGSLTQLSDNGGHLKKIYNSEAGIYAVTMNGIFFVDNSLNHELVVDFSPYLKEEVIGVDGFISPDFTKAVIQVECDPTSLQKDFIEIISITK